METIPLKTVDAVWERVNSLDEKGSNEVAMRFRDLQPFILVYLLAYDEELFPDDERGRLLELGMYLLEVMYSCNGELPQVTDRELELALAANIKYLEGMADKSESQNEASVRSLLANYNQTPLLGALLEALTGGQEEEPDMEVDNTGLAFVHLKTVIDCLDR